jgi:uncharacterized protein YjbI with pentapeptide repeats
MAILRDYGLVITITVAALALLTVVWWWVPKLQMRGRGLSSEKETADVEDNFRKTVGQGLGGLVVLIGAGIAYYGTQRTLQAGAEQARQAQQAAQDLLISNQVSKGFEQLAGSDMVMRLGGIYALEAVMNTSDRYRRPVLEALSAFVRVSTVGKLVDKKPASDVQAALVVIGRRAIPSQGPGEVILDGSNLVGADLVGADLRIAHLSGAFLSGADLINADLGGAVLEDVDLRGANLTNANLSDTPTPSFGPPGANALTVLAGSQLSGADLTGANLLNALGLEQNQLDEACGDDTHLPPHITLKPCPPNRMPVARLNQQTTPKPPLH